MIVILFLLIIFNAIRSSKLNVLEKKLSNIENYLKHVQFSQSRQEIKKPEPVKDTPKVETPPVVPPITTPPPVVPPVVETPPVPQSIKTPPPIKEPEVKRVYEARNIPPPVKPPIPKKSWYDTFRENNPDLEKLIG